jgi:hypothetical protein
MQSHFILAGADACKGGTASNSPGYPTDQCAFLPMRVAEDTSEFQLLETPPFIWNEDRVNFLKVMVSDTFADSLGTVEEAFNFRYAAYVQLAGQDSILSNDSTLQAFWEEADNAGEGRVYRYCNALGIDTTAYAEQLMQQWVPESGIEGFYKTAFGIYRRITQTDSLYLTSTEKEQLESIAELCPNPIGQPVWLSRSILSLFTTNSYVSDCELALAYLDTTESGGANGGDTLSVTDELTVYPNPGDDAITLSHLPNGNGVSVRILNLYGVSVYEGNFPNNDIEIQWNSSEMIEGLFYALLLDLNGNVLDFSPILIYH